MLCAALSISAATSCGCDTIDIWLDGTRVILAPASRANKFCTAGLSALSFSVNKYHDGLLCQAARLTFSLKAFAAIGCCAAASKRA